MTCEERLDRVLAQVRAEVLRAAEKHAPMPTAHHGYAVIQEEVDELWTEVKADNGQSPEAFKEARQIAAMGIRYILDLDHA